MSGIEYAEKAITAVIRERGRQDEMWGEQNHSPGEWILIAMEELGEAAQAMNVAQTTNNATIGFYCREMIQVAAVCVAALESAQRNEGVTLP